LCQITISPPKIKSTAIKFKKSLEWSIKNNLKISGSQKRQHATNSYLTDVTQVLLAGDSENSHK